MQKLRKHIEEITPISDEKFGSIKPFFTIRKVLKNQYLIQQGDDAFPGTTRTAESFEDLDVLSCADLNFSSISSAMGEVGRALRWTSF